MNVVQPPNEWATADHALEYLAHADQVPHRREAEACLLDIVPKDVERILDLGTGDGRLLALLLMERGDAEGVAVDFSPTMLAKARERFLGNGKVAVLDHNLDEPLPDLGRFDAIVSSFAIHHCTNQRKKSLYTEIYAALAGGGAFCNLEHVAPESAELHGQFLQEFGITEEEEDPSNKLVSLETQLQWLQEIGFKDVRCHWQWLELALFKGMKST